MQWYVVQRGVQPLGPKEREGDKGGRHRGARGGLQQLELQQLSNPRVLRRRQQWAPPPLQHSHSNNTFHTSFFPDSQVVLWCGLPPVAGVTVQMLMVTGPPTPLTPLLSS